ncbi:MAG: insulinase family protein [Gemmatimonadaceae bacterium]|nr:insulinase family protein [Gemmatimonadaceae bacterium]
MMRPILVAAGVLGLGATTVGSLAPASAIAAPRGAVAPDTAVTTRFEVAGIPVILRRNPANEVVVANLYLLGGARQLTPQNAGIEALLLAASERGTRRFPGSALRQRTARLGSTISIEASDDWSMIGLHAIRATFDSTWALMADRVVAPTLEPNDVEIVREQMLTGVRERRTDPDNAATELADSLLFGQHPYAIPTTGTETSLSALTVAQLRQYHAQQFVTSRMLLVVVGNVDRPQVERLVRATIGTLPRGSYRWTPPPALPDGARAVAFDNRMLPTNYLLGYVPGPPATSPDYTALRVATAVLSGRLFTEVRSRRNLSYAVESPFLERSHAVGGLYVTTVDPNAVLRIMRTELTALQSDEVEAAGLKRLEQQFITEYYLKNETNADQANVLARAELYQGDYRAADRFMSELRRVTPADVERVAKTYLTNFRFAFVGDTTKVDRALLSRF